MENGVDRSATTPFCPSAQPDWEGGMILGVVLGTAEAPRLAHLEMLQPVTDELMALAGPVSPTEVFRIAAPCLGSGCTSCPRWSNCSRRVRCGLPAAGGGRKGGRPACGVPRSSPTATPPIWS
jgi:hypothetical protein